MKYGAYLEIQQINGKIHLPSDETVFHIGKQDIQACGSAPLPDPKGFSSISSMRKNASGDVIKEQFIITNNNGSYTIQDLHSTNGTYIGSLDLKKSGTQPIKDGELIVLPIEEHGKLVQLKIYFKIVKNQSDIANMHQPWAKASSSQNTQPQSQYSTPQYSQPQSSSPQSPSPQYAAPQYNAPNQKAKSGPTSPSSVKAVSIQKGTAPQPTYTDPDDDDYDPMDDSSNSFIVVQQQIPIPPDAFRPNSGVDLSMVYKLEKSELWHIFIAFSMMVLMVYRTTLNAALISIAMGATMTAEQIFVDPLPISLIFGFTFIVHEMAHLQTGKHNGFQSRFCLTKVGVSTTIKAIIIGLPFGLPGAAVSVGVDPAKDEDKMGWIKFAGPFSNMILGTIFLIVAIIIPIENLILKQSIMQGATLNYVLGAFNMVPKEIKGFALDGRYIIKWKKKLYFGLLLCFAIGMIVALTLLMSVFPKQYAAHLAVDVPMM
jgi:Zn-dependent protease